MNQTTQNFPLVSIIVPVHNSERTIKRCVNSLINQTYTNIEIILVENGSKDKSWQICESFMDKRIITIRLNKGSVSIARNKGLEIAQGVYIAFCDSDDFYSPDHIKENIDVALRENSDLVISGYFFEKNGEFVPCLKENSKKITNKKELVINIVTTDYVMGACWNKFFKRTIIKNSIFPENLNILEDTYFLFNLLKNTSTIFYLAKPLYYYCYNPFSAVRNANSLMVNDHFAYITAYKKLLKDFYFDKDIQELLHAKIFEFAIDAKYIIKTNNLESPQLLFNIQEELRSNRSAFYKCKYFSIKRKLKDILKLHMPAIREVKSSFIKKNSV